MTLRGILKYIVDFIFSHANAPRNAIARQQVWLCGCSGGSNRKQPDPGEWVLTYFLPDKDFHDG